MRRTAATALATSLFIASARSGSGAESEPGTDLTVLPYGGGDSDIGIGAGLILSVARLTGEHEPYLWRLETVSLATFRTPAVDGERRVELPYVDSYLLLSLPHAVERRLRLFVRISYTQELRLKYYGIGNAAELPPGAELRDDRFVYSRVHPTFRVRGESRLFSDVTLIHGFAYTHNWLGVAPDSLLAEQRETAPLRVREMLGPTSEHGVAEFSYGLAWDGRDDLVSPERGMYHTARVDLAPGGIPAVPSRWARLNGALRFYLPLAPRRATLALRAVGDVLLGEPPFYELPRFDDTGALGGPKGVRGVPGQRYYGKVKLFSNVELRTRLLPFELFGQENTLGFNLFADTGRVWSDFTPEPELDGEGLGLKLGLGGGIRVYGGQSFVVRGDVAWSPDARPVGAYLGAGEIF